MFIKVKCISQTIGIGGISYGNTSTEKVAEMFEQGIEGLRGKIEFPSMRGSQGKRMQ